MTESIHARVNALQRTSGSRGPWRYCSCLLSLIWSGQLLAQEQPRPQERAQAAEQQLPLNASAFHGEPLAALDADALLISANRNYGPLLKHQSVIVGEGPPIRGTHLWFGASCGAASWSRLHLSLIVDLHWADGRSQRVVLGGIPAERALANALRLPASGYEAYSGVSDVGLTAAGIYQLGDHWALVARFGMHLLLGTSTRGPPADAARVSPQCRVRGDVQILRL